MDNKSTLIFLIAAFGTFVNAQSWQTDFEQAKAVAVKENRKLILVFQGSDWCSPCMKLDREVWSSAEFKSYAKAHFVMLKADFPRKKKNALVPEQQAKNNILAEMYNKDGFFPLVVVLDKNGRVLGKTGYKKMTPAEYINLLASF